MSTYALELEAAKLTALRELVAALAAADSPAEKRRCATAILRIPDPKPATQAAPQQSLASGNAAPPPAPTSRVEHPTSDISPPTSDIESLNARLEHIVSELEAATECNDAYRAKRREFHAIYNQLRERLPDLPELPAPNLVTQDTG